MKDPQGDWLPPSGISAKEAFRQIDRHYRWWRRLARTLRASLFGIRDKDYRP